MNSALLATGTVYLSIFSYIIFGEKLKAKFIIGMMFVFICIGLFAESDTGLPKLESEASFKAI